MDFPSPFVPGAFGYTFLEGRVQALPIMSVEFVDPKLYKTKNRFGVVVYVLMPDGQTRQGYVEGPEGFSGYCLNGVKEFIESQCLFPSVEGLLETLLPQNLRGMKVALSGDPLPMEKPAPAPAPTPAPAPHAPQAPAENLAEKPAGRRPAANSKPNPVPSPDPADPFPAD